MKKIAVLCPQKVTLHALKKTPCYVLRGSGLSRKDADSPSQKCQGKTTVLMHSQECQGKITVLMHSQECQGKITVLMRS